MATDKRLRDLERRAALGDQDATAERDAMLLRCGMLLESQSEAAARGAEVAGHAGRRLLLPDARKWREVFLEEIPWGHGKAPAWAEQWHVRDVVHGKRRSRTITSTVPIGPYCAIRWPGLSSLFVRATPAVYDAIRSSMLASSRDSIDFEVVIRGEHEHERTALVLAKNNLIIGSRWIAILPAIEIPAL